MTPTTAAHGRYTRTAIALHWLLGLALLAQICFGFLLDEIAPRGTPARSGVINLHKSCGIVLAAVIGVRLYWRLSHAPPPWPARMSQGERRAAKWVHGALYACMVLMPLSGYVASNFSRFGIVFFGHALPPWAPALPQVYALLNGLHIGTAYLFSFLIAGHIIAALKHVLIDHDNMFSRMLT